MSIQAVDIYNTDGAFLVDKTYVKVQSHKYPDGSEVFRMNLAPSKDFQYKSKSSLMVVLQGSGTITDTETEQSQPLFPGNTIHIDKDTVVNITNTNFMEMVLMFTQT